MDQWVVTGSDVGYAHVYVCYREMEQLWSMVPETWIHPDSRYSEGE